MPWGKSSRVYQTFTTEAIDITHCVIKIINSGISQFELQLLDLASLAFGNKDIKKIMKKNM